MKNLSWLFFIGMYLTLTIYHLLIFIGRKEEKINFHYFLLGLTSMIWLFSRTILLLFIKSENIIHCIQTFSVLLIAYPCVLFVYSVLELKKFKKHLNLLSIILLLIPTLISAIFNIFYYKTFIDNVFFIIYTTSSVSFGIILWVYSLFLFFKLKYYKDIWRLYAFISISTYSIFYFIYPILLLFGIEQNIRLITASTGVILMLLLSAYSITKRFNHEHKDLIDLKNNLEKKVIIRTKQLEEAHNQKNIFFINLAHETKTPLTLISNYLDKYLRKNNSSEELDIIQYNINKLKNDMVNFLDIKKLERGQNFYNHENITHFSKLISDLIILFKEVAWKKNIKIESNIEKNIYIKIDPYAAERIINNLIDNAIKYTNEYGNIMINLKTNNDIIELIVKDNGIGISEDQQKHIFEPYYQLSHKKINIQGIGMGLNIVKKIVDDVNGKITIESKLKYGSQFKINLKKHNAFTNEINHTVSIPPNKIIISALEEEKIEENRKNILIVEDNIQMLKYLQDSLSDEYNIFIAQNGVIALDKLENIPKPNVIISDIMMDEMNGFEFFDELNKNTDFNSIPFIFLTAKTSIENKIKGLEKGAVDYIHKPFLISEILNKIKSILQIQENQIIKNMESINTLVSKMLNNELQENDENIKFSTICNENKINKIEQEIIIQLINGSNYESISTELNLSLSSIKNRIHNIYKKLKIQNKIELINLFED